MNTPVIPARARYREPFDLGAELRIVPTWAWVLAVLVFAGVQVLFHAYAWPREPNPPAMAFQVLFPLLIALLPACFMLLVGYVNRDAGRRGMSRTLWTIIVLVVPYALGFLVYVLVRNPRPVSCPECGGVVSSGANFCPHCGSALLQTCPWCKAPAGSGDRFCANCGTALETKDR